ncbi:MAG TPA: DUF3500 domain-containing protein [Verrucomicrobiales bacterium]|nr:DUF3500 domain-containing protein [Verrucomicrobiales bacterium]
MFGHDLYWIGIFGDLANDDTCGCQLDGHHLALNITVVGNDVSVRPAFMGSDPAKLPEGTYSDWYVKVAEDEKVKRLFESLRKNQRAKVIIAEEAPRDVITGPINHIHTVFREPGNDYGDDLLRKHLLESRHHREKK